MQTTGESIEFIHVCYQIGGRASDSQFNRRGRCMDSLQGHTSTKFERPYDKYASSKGTYADHRDGSKRCYCITPHIFVREQRWRPLRFQAQLHPDKYLDEDEESGR